MVKKNKIVDVIFWDSEINILKFRLKELNDIVDNFVVVNCGKNVVDTMDIQNEKTTFLYFDKSLDSFYDNTQLALKETFMLLELDFEDILVFSECDEIPDFDYYEQFLNNIDYSPFYINHTVFQWDKHYYSENKKLGSLVSNFSYFIQSLTTVRMYFTNKNNVLFGDTDAITCGWKLFNLFCEKNETNQLLIDEMLECCDNDPVKSNPLVKLKGDEKLPKNFHILPYKFEKRTNTKKHLIIIDSSNKENQNNYDSLSIIYFSKTFPETFAVKSENGELVSTLFLPDKVLYGQKSYEDFVHDYKMNDSKRIIHTVFPQDQDIIILVIDSTIYLFQWEVWKNRNLCELKNPSY